MHLKRFTIKNIKNFVARFARILTMTLYLKYMEIMHLNQFYSRKNIGVGEVLIFYRFIGVRAIFERFIGFQKSRTPPTYQRPIRVPYKNLFQGCMQPMQPTAN